MIPAILAAQLAKPLVKWALIIGGVLLVLIGVWLHGRTTGKAIVQLAWDASTKEQALAASAQLIAEAEMSNQVLKAHAKDIRAAETATTIVEREVIRYVQAPAKPCVVDPEFVRVFDAVTRLSEPADDRVSTTDGSTGESIDTSETELTTAEVLQAYYAAVEELTMLWIDYSGLVQWERGRLIVQQTQQDAL